MQGVQVCPLNLFDGDDTADPENGPKAAHRLRRRQPETMLLRTQHHSDGRRRRAQRVDCLQVLLLLHEFQCPRLGCVPRTVLVKTVGREVLPERGETACAHGLGRGVAEMQCHVKSRDGFAQQTSRRVVGGIGGRVRLDQVVQRQTDVCPDVSAK
jgi:hypothetical protein